MRLGRGARRRFTDGAPSFNELFLMLIARLRGDVFLRGVCERPGRLLVSIWVSAHSRTRHTSAVELARLRLLKNDEELVQQREENHTNTRRGRER